MKGVIYCYHCISTGKKYIGQTICEEKRKKEHHRKSKNCKSKFYNAVRKYGWESFIYGIIGEYDVDCLDEQEILHINLNNSYCNGYNSTIGGGGVRGFIPSKETRKKQSISAKNRTDIHPRKKYFTEDEKNKAKKEYQKEYQKQYRKNNKEKLKEKYKEWRNNNQDKIEKWKEENKEYLKQIWKEKREKNKEYYQKYGKEWREKNKERIKEMSKRYYNNVVKTKNKLSQEDCLD
jgi:group I intron endonuclease